MKKLLIVGTSGHAKVVLECALSTDNYTSISFLAKDSSAEIISGYPCFNEDEMLHRDKYGIDYSFYDEFDEVIVAIGNNKARLEKAHLLLNNNVKLATIIHKKAVVSEFSKIHEGTVVLANAVVNPFSTIGIASIINTGAIVEHDCLIGDGVHISPNSTIAGSVSVGDKSWVCLGCSVSNNVRIGASSIVGAGGVVLEDVPCNVLVAGIPAEIKKHYPVVNTTSYRYAILDDCNLVFEWANDSLVRENSHNKEPIVYENHVAWFQRKLASTDSWMFIALREELPVGLLRLDRQNSNDLLISYSVMKEFRGSGVGKDIICMIPHIIGNENISCDKIVAEVFYSNEASNKIFVFAGYQRQDSGSQYVYIKNL